MSAGKSFDHQVLVFEDECGLWLKAPDFNIQICTENLEVGIGLLEEQVEYAMRIRHESGDEFPEDFEWTFRNVSREEYGPTLMDIAREEDFEGEEDFDGEAH